MKKSLRLLAIFMALAMSLAITSCGKKPAEELSSQEDLFSDTESESSNNDVASDGAESSVGIENIDALKNIMNVNGKTCTIMANAENKYLIDEYKKQCGGTLKYIIEDYSNMKLRLAQLQMSDQAPDIYVVGNQDYPTMLFRDQFEALDEHIKLDAPEWNGVKEAIGKYKYNGKHYILNSGNRVSRMIWWNSNIFNEMGCKDTPESLMQKGKWDWDTMQRLAEETTDIKNGIYGFGYMYSLSWAYQASAGENLVTMTGDGVINNTDSPNIAKAMDAFSKISTNKILYQNDSNPQQAFANGKIAMYFDTCEMGGADNIRAQVNNGTIKLAHFPKMPGAESYVYSGEFNGYAIPKGAKNIDCAVAFLAMTRAQAAYQDEVKNKYYSDCGFNEYDKKIYEEANKCEFVDNVALGLSDVLEVCKPIEVELKLGAPWSTVKNKCKPKIQAALDSIGS